MTADQIKKAMKQDIQPRFKVMDDVISTLQKLQHDTRLTKQEQQDISIAWGYLYYINEGEKIFFH